MTQRLPILAIVLLAVLGSGTPAWAQDDFLFWTGDFDSRPISTATVELGLVGRITQRSDTFIFELERQDWPLVIIRRHDAPEPAVEREIIDLLDAHLARGGRLLVNFAELDEMPDMQRFLGLEGAVDIQEPLQFADTVVYDRRFHPAAAGGPLPTTSFPAGPDFGDVLVPGASTRPIFQFRDDLTVASVLGHDGRVIVNGWEWSSWGFGVDVATEQLRWLTTCPADLDGSGSLDLFDFLEFQRLFDEGDPKADWFCYDGRLDVFDFLAFFNAFEAGCP